MKRILAFLLVGLMIFMMSACSYELVDPEDFSVDSNKQVMDDWKEDYRDYFVDIESDEEEEPEEEEEKPAEEQKKPAAEKKPTQNNQQSQQTQQKEPIVETPIIEQIIQKPIVTEPEPQPEPEQTPETTPETTPESQEQPYKNPPRRGEFNDDSYINEYAGLNIRWTNGWMTYTDQQIGQMIGYDSKTYNLKALLDDNSAVGSMYELLAVGPEGASIQIMYSNLRKMGQEYMTTERYLDELCSALDGQEGYTCDRSKRYKTKLSQATWHVQVVDLEKNGVAVPITYYVQKIDCFIVSMVVTKPQGYDQMPTFY